MKRIKQSPDFDLKPIQIFRDDLEYIESELKNELAGSDFSISLGEYEYSSVDEVPDNHKKVHELTITTTDPYTRIALRRMIANISSTDSSLNTIGALRNIEQRLNKRTRKFRYYIVRPLGIIGSIFLLGVTPLLALESIPVLARFVLIVLTILTFPFILIAAHQFFRTYSTVNFEKERKGFYSRNKDTILVGLIVAVFTAVLTYLATALLQ